MDSEIECTFGKFADNTTSLWSDEDLAQLSREAVVPHPWRRLRQGWMGPWAASPGGGSRAHSTGLGLSRL